MKSRYAHITGRVIISRNTLLIPTRKCFKIFSLNQCNFDFSATLVSVDQTTYHLYVKIYFEKLYLCPNSNLFIYICISSIGLFFHLVDAFVHCKIDSYVHQNASAFIDLDVSVYLMYAYRCIYSCRFICSPRCIFLFPYRCISSFRKILFI